MSRVTIGAVRAANRRTAVDLRRRARELEREAAALRSAADRLRPTTPKKKEDHHA